MKKSTKWNLMLLLIFASSVLACFIYPIVSCSKNKIGNKINVLSADLVQKNFNSDGIWFNKNNLTYEDFDDFQMLNVDAFNYIDKELEFIELPSNIKLNCNDEPIRWKTINEIRIKTIENQEQNFISLNKILFYKKNNEEYEALSIIDRTNNENLIFPSYINTKNNFKYYSIVDDFFEPLIFKNIEQILFEEEILIKNIGNRAFLNCNKLSDDLIFKIYNINELFWFKNYYFSFGKNSFKNTNIRSLDIQIPSIRYNNLNSINVEIGESAFEGNKNLSQFILINKDFIIENEYTDSIISIANKAFYDCDNLTDIIFILNGTLPTLSLSTNCFSFSDNNEQKIDRNIYINSGRFWFDDEIFKGNYNSFNLSIFLNSKTIDAALNINMNIKDLFTFDKLSFNEIIVENNTNFNLLTNVNIELFSNVGLSNEQYEKIKYISSILN